MERGKKSEERDIEEMKMKMKMRGKEREKKGVN